MVMAGCGQPAVAPKAAVPSKVELPNENKVHELVGKAWGKTLYAPGQYAGFTYDSTGIYGNLNGDEQQAGTIPVVAVKFVASKREGSQLVETAWRMVYLANYEFTSSNIPTSAAMHGFTDDQFKWLDKDGRTKAQEKSIYYRTFWISWKGFGLDGPPVGGELWLAFEALTPKEPGYAFIVDHWGQK
jgi:hypothetical protein